MPKVKKKSNKKKRVGLKKPMITMAGKKRQGGITNTLNKFQKVPNSCIESAEFIMRVYNTDSKEEVKWYGSLGDSADEAPQPHVWAEFGNYVLNISDTAFESKIPNNATNYDFTVRGLPKIGEGICVIKKGAFEDVRYNMHFGAVISEKMRSVCISDMSEPENYNNEVAEVNTMDISCVKDFITGGYEGNDYVIGLLTVNPDMKKTEIK